MNWNAFAFFLPIALKTATILKMSLVLLLLLGSLFYLVYSSGLFQQSSPKILWRKGIIWIFSFFPDAYFHKKTKKGQELLSQAKWAEAIQYFRKTLLFDGILGGSNEISLHNEAIFNQVQKLSAHVGFAFPKQENDRLLEDLQDYLLLKRAKYNPEDNDGTLLTHKQNEDRFMGNIHLKQEERLIDSFRSFFQNVLDNLEKHIHSQGSFLPIVEEKQSWSGEFEASSLKAAEAIPSTHGKKVSDGNENAVFVSQPVAFQSPVSGNPFDDEEEEEGDTELMKLKSFSGSSSVMSNDLLIPPPLPSKESLSNLYGLSQESISHGNSLPQSPEKSLSSLSRIPEVAPPSTANISGFQPPMNQQPNPTGGFPGFQPPMNPQPNPTGGFPGLKPPMNPQPNPTGGFPGLKPPMNPQPNPTGGFPGFQPPVNPQPNPTGGFPGFQPPVNPQPNPTGGFPGFQPPVNPQPNPTGGFPGFQPPSPTGKFPSLQPFPQGKPTPQNNPNQGKEEDAKE